ncbi:MAG: cupin domain-containing protein [Gammaproteobacteria bacterium]|nr:cupin domain-containing protein [Gammaproteobacteria bacterium]
MKPFPLPLPQGMSAETFLAEYWQKKPLLIKAAFPDFKTPLCVDEIAGMACEEGIESRLILERDGDTKWQLNHGPFDQSIFAELPQSHWTLLIQEVHKYVPELAQLLESFRFIPNWRIDDIMVSYSPVDGSVGPHVDQYDVFLLQGLGRKRWQISTAEVCDGDLISGIDLQILSHFEAEQNWELEEGDMLYLPPGVIHHGVALGESLTYSVGFRAPAEFDLMTSFIDYLAEESLAVKHYRDPDLSLQQHPGEISAASLQRVREIINSMPVNDDDLACWFGQVVTESKSGDRVESNSKALSVDAFVERFQQGETLFRCELSRFACIAQDSATLLFVAGTLTTLSSKMKAAVYLLCDQRMHLATEWAALLETPDNVALLCRLYNEGHLYFDND